MAPQWYLIRCVCVYICLTGEHGQPLQAYLDHMMWFLGLVQGDGLRALLLHIQLQVILQVTAHPWERDREREKARERLNMLFPLRANCLPVISAAVLISL